jgi:dihydrofolate reductase
MQKPLVSMIAAIGKNRELGRDNKLLWKIPEDTQYFRDTTRGHAVIMGRRTYESIGRPLPDRANIVVSRDLHYRAPGCEVVARVETALARARELEKKEIFIIGGGQIYAEGLPHAQRLYLTLVEGEFEADAFFPDYSEFTKVVFRRDSEGNGYKFSFVVLER